MEPTRAPWAREGPNHLDVQPPRVSARSDTAEDTAGDGSAPGMRSLQLCANVMADIESYVSDQSRCSTIKQQVHHQASSRLDVPLDHNASDLQRQYPIITEKEAT